LWPYQCGREATANLSGSETAGVPSSFSLWSQRTPPIFSTGDPGTMSNSNSRPALITTVGIERRTASIFSWSPRPPARRQDRRRAAGRTHAEWHSMNIFECSLTTTYFCTARGRALPKGDRAVAGVLGPRHYHLLSRVRAVPFQDIDTRHCLMSGCCEGEVPHVRRCGAACKAVVYEPRAQQQLRVMDRIFKRPFLWPGAISQDRERCQFFSA
jgi:hypothetical protein